MKNRTLSARLIALTAVLAVAAVTAPASAGTSSATFQASLTIVGSCAIDSSALRPQVACSYASAAYRIDQTSAAVAQTQVQGNLWTVTF